MLTPHRDTPVTTGPFTILPYIPQQFQHVKQTLSIDRIRYWIEPAQYPNLHPHLGPIAGITFKKGRKIFTHSPPNLGKSVSRSISLSNYWAKVLIIVDDPSDTDQKFLLELFQSCLLPGGYGLNEVEIALDLHLERLEQLPLLKKWVLGHLGLPYARKSPRPSKKALYAINDTWYLGSKRGGPRSTKVYVKRIGEDEHTEFLRLEVTVHGRFESYGIPKCGVVYLESIRLEKLFQWREFDSQRAAELAYQRIEGSPIRTLRRQDQWIDLTLASYRNYIEAKVSPEGGPDHVKVLGQMMDRCREQDWWRPQDKDKVFPFLVPAESPGEEL